VLVLKTSEREITNPKECEPLAYTSMVQAQWPCPKLDEKSKQSNDQYIWKKRSKRISFMELQYFLNEPLASSLGFMQ